MVKAGTTGRFGPRYGTRTKKIVAVIEAEQKKPQQCQRCERFALKRLAAGIWLCKKCGVKFAGGAYFPRSAIGEEIKTKLSEINITPVQSHDEKNKISPSQERSEQNKISPVQKQDGELQ